MTRLACMVVGGVAGLAGLAGGLACGGPPQRVVAELPDASLADAGIDGPGLPALPPRLLYLADERAAATDPPLGVLYLATFSENGVLASVSRASVAPGDQSVALFGWSPTGRRAFFVAGAPAELYVIALDEQQASVPARLNRPLAASVAGVLEAQFSPDGDAIAYRIERVPGSSDVYAVDLRGEEPGSPSHASVSGFIDDFAWAPDSRAIAFRTPTFDQRELYVVEVDGATPGGRERVSVPPPHPYGVEASGPTGAGYAWSPNAGRLLYRADQERHPMFTGQTNLYIATIDPWPPSEPIRLNAFLSSPADDVDEMVWSPDSRYVGYRAEGNKLFVVDAASETPNPIELLAAVRPGVTRPEIKPVFSPDSRWLAFHATEVATSVTELFAVDLRVSPLAATRINPPLIAPQSVVESSGCQGVPSIAWAPDSSALVYASDERTTGQTELFAVDMSGSAPAAPAVVNGPLTVVGDVTGCPARWSADSRSILFRAVDIAPGPGQLYLTAAGDLGNPRIVNGPMPASGDVTDGDWGWSPADDALAYLADERIDDQVELFVTGRAAGATSTRVSLDLPLDGNVVSFAWAP